MGIPSSLSLLAVLVSVLLVQTAAATQIPAASQTPSPETQALGKSWDAAYLDPSHSLEPNAFLVEMVRDVKPGTALDVGMGQGRNALYLAKQGWTVTGFDPSGLASGRLARPQQKQESV